MQLPDLKALTSVTSVTRDPPVGDPPGADADALADVIDLNYISIDEDASLAQLRGGAARGLVGVWPLAALLNHSCAPNTATVAVEVRRGEAFARRAAAFCRRMQPPHDQALSPLSCMHAASCGPLQMDCARASRGRMCMRAQLGI